MNRFRTLLGGAVASSLLIGLMAGGGALASDRIPVSSLDDVNLSVANRIGAVDNVVVAMNGRLGRILSALPEGHPPSPIFESLDATRSVFGTLVATIDSRLCNQDAILGSGDSSLADGDVYAGDPSSSGLLNQLGSVRRVLSEANGRLVRILGSHPPGPIDEARSGLITVRASVVAGYEGITGRLGDGIHPPSPCFDN